jgi:hypothetical protein
MLRSLRVLLSNFGLALSLQDACTYLNPKAPAKLQSSIIHSAAIITLHLPRVLPRLEIAIDIFLSSFLALITTSGIYPRNGTPSFAAASPLAITC